jgi:hypothetical protein
MEIKRHDLPSESLLSWLATLPKVAGRIRARMLAAALIAAATVIIATTSRAPLFESSAEISVALSEKSKNILPSTGPYAGERATQGLAFQPASVQGRLFPLILSSRSVCNQVLADSYNYSLVGAPRTTDLYGYLGTQNKDAAFLLLKTRIVGFYFDPRTGTTRLSALTESPELSYQIVIRFISALEDCLDRIHDRGIRLNLAAIETKLNDAERTLFAHEEKLRTMREQNRDFKSFNDPKLYLEQQQIEREIELNSALVVALKSSYELAMSELFKDGMRVETIVTPSPASRPKYPKFGRSLVLSACCGCIAALIVLLVYALCLGLTESERRKWLGLLNDLLSGFRLRIAEGRLRLRLKQATHGK